MKPRVAVFLIPALILVFPLVMAQSTTLRKTNHLAQSANTPGCRYYTMTDLSSGRELSLLSDFGAAEPPPKTREGYPYVTDLVTRANSKLLVAQYRIDSPRGEECRERAFVFDADKLTPTAGTRRTCTQY